MIFPRVSLAVMGAKDALTFRHDFLSGSIAVFIRVWLLVLVYSSALGESHETMNINRLIVYLFLACAVSEFTRMDVVDEVSRAVMQGTAALDLCCPVSWPTRLFWSRLGERAVGLLGETFPAMIVLAVILKPQISVSPPDAILGMISVALGFWISFHISLFFAILAIKLVQAWGIRLLEGTLFTLFSGVLFPKELLPPAFAFLTSVLPFQLAVQGPVQILTGNAGHILILQCFWACLLPLFIRYLFRRVTLQMVGFGG